VQGVLTSKNKHVTDFDDTRMFQSLENLDFSKGSDRHTLLLVVHENPLKSDGITSLFMDSLVNLSVHRGKNMSVNSNFS
jgi:hypothetical protein